MLGGDMLVNIGNDCVQDDMLYHKEEGLDK